MNIQDQIKQRQQKWQREKELHQNLKELGLDDECNKAGSQGNNQNQNNQILAELTMKIQEKMTDKLNKQQIDNNKNQQQLTKHEIRVEKAISNEVEQNTCPICYELMVPPQYSPILLFPCGHTFCKDCIFRGKDVNKMDKCPFCRKKITSSAINISLQNLICIFTNNKHLLDQSSEQSNQKQHENSNQNQFIAQEDENNYSEKYEMCKMRSQILMDEKNDLESQNHKISKDISTHKKVKTRLQQQREETLTRIEKLHQELQLIDKYIFEGDQEMSEKQMTQENNIKKIQLVESSLQSIIQDQNKYKVLKLANNIKE